MPHTPPRRLLEIAIESAGDAVTASAAGADRFELCAALEIGGLTPSLGVFESVRAATDRPVLPMLRPRAGGFTYDDAEFRAMLVDAERFLAAGADGVVCGCLRPDSTIDAARMRDVVRAAGTRQVVFHRAFDLTAEPLPALECLLELGIMRLLTSGGCVSTVEPAARVLLRRLVTAAAGRIEIMAGSGVRADNVGELLAETGCDMVHSSCRATRADASPMGRRAAAMHFGVSIDEGLGVSALDAAAVAALRAAIDRP